MGICRFNVVTTQNSRSSAINSSVGSNGLLKFYTGAPPADASVAATGTLLSTHNCSATFGGGGSVIMTPASITSGAQVNVMSLVINES